MNNQQQPQPNNMFTGMNMGQPAQNPNNAFNFMNQQPQGNQFNFMNQGFNQQMQQPMQQQMPTMQ
jgi:hypothetical protein